MSVNLCTLLQTYLNFSMGVHRLCVAYYYIYIVKYLRVSLRLFFLWFLLDAYICDPHQKRPFKGYFVLERERPEVLVFSLERVKSSTQASSN